jgi:cell wall assembly regulator SMI1
MSYADIFEQKEVFVISHMGERPWQVQHHFETAASDESIDLAEGDIGIKIPDELRAFWKVSDGAVLFKALQSPEWGWRIVSSQRYLESQHKYRRKFFDTWKMEYLLVAELLAPRVAVVWNYQTDEVIFLETESGSMQEIVIGTSITDFFSKLAKSQGSLYWKWT